MQYELTRSAPAARNSEVSASPVTPIMGPKEREKNRSKWIR